MCSGLALDYSVLMKGDNDVSFLKQQLILMSGLVLTLEITTR